MDCAKKMAMRIRSSFSAFLLTFLGILSAVAVPSGMMTAWGAGGFTITMCDSSATQLTVQRDDPQYETLRILERAKRIAGGESLPAQDHDQEAENGQCAFAGTGTGQFTLPEPIAFASINHTQIFSDPANVSISVGHRLHLPPSTGPPVAVRSNIPAPYERTGGKCRFSDKYRKIP